MRIRSHHMRDLHKGFKANRDQKAGGDHTVPGIDPHLQPFFKDAVEEGMPETEGSKGVEGRCVDAGRRVG